MLLGFRRTVAALSLVTCLALVVAGCGSSKKKASAASPATTPAAPRSTPATTTAANAAVAALVPASIKSKGTLAVAADASYAPDEFFAPDGHTVIGMDADLSKALGDIMGLKTTVSNVTFDAIIPALASGKYDMGASSFTDTKAREKVVDFVDYASVGESFFTKAQGGTTINSIADICGKTVAVQKATTELADATTQSGKCKKAGKPAVKLVVFTLETDVNLALVSGRAQLGFADTPVAGYAVTKSNGQLKLTGASFATAPYGFAVPRQPGLAKAVLAALKVLMQNGSYASVLSKWGLSGGAITNPGINGAIG